MITQTTAEISKSAWFESFFKTPEGKAYSHGERKYAVELGCRRRFSHRGRPGRPVRPDTAPSADGPAAMRRGSSLWPATTSPCPPSPAAAAMSPWTWARSGSTSSGSTTSRSAIWCPATTRNAADGRPLDLGRFARQVRAAGFLGDLPLRVSRRYPRAPGRRTTPSAVILASS